MPMRIKNTKNTKNRTSMQLTESKWGAGFQNVHDVQKVLRRCAVPPGFATKLWHPRPDRGNDIFYSPAVNCPRSIESIIWGYSLARLLMSYAVSWPYRRNHRIHGHQWNQHPSTTVSSVANLPPHATTTDRTTVFEVRQPKDRINVHLTIRVCRASRNPP